MPGIGRHLRNAAKSVKDAIAAAVLPGALVNELGFKYIGYVDGHNVPMLVAALEEAKKIDDGPVIVHALTTKGKGFPNPEKNYYAYHATGPFDPKTGLPYKSSKSRRSTYTQIFGETMCELMAKDDTIVALTAAMPDGTGVDKVLEKFPERSFDVGIAEQHAVTFCAGMACEGLKPVAAIYSTFLQRAFDQVIHDVCLQDLNVTFAMDRAGIVGADGPTHHGLLDIAYLRGYPNIVLMAPKDEAEMRDMMLTAIEYHGPGGDPLSARKRLWRRYQRAAEKNRYRQGGSSSGRRRCRDYRVRLDGTSGVGGGGKSCKRTASKRLSSMPASSNLSTAK